MSGKKKMEGNPDANLTSVGNYVFSKTLGEGNFAKVKLAKHKITSQEIIDKMSLDDKKLAKLYREVRIMKLLHHPNIVKLYEVVETKYTIFLVMEYVSGGELYDYLVVHGRMKEKEARAKFRQILSAVSYCHKKRVIHRDLKAENLLLDENNNIKIADFGFSNQFDPDGKLDTFCGSPPYAAPELFQGKRYTGPEVDVWSCGVILYVLTTGCLPFDGKNLQEMRESVTRGKYRIPFYLSETCEKLLRKFLVRDPSKRPSLDILVDDEWLNEGYDGTAITQDVVETLVGEDPVVLQVMEQRFGVSKEDMIKGLRGNEFNENMAIYFLLYDEKIKNGDGAVMKIGETMGLKTPLPAPVQQQPPSATPIHVIQEEDGSTENVNSGKPVAYQPVVETVVSRRKSSIAQPPPAPSSGAAKVAPQAGSPTNQPVPEQEPNGAPQARPAIPNVATKRARRATVSGDAEMQKIAAAGKEDAELLAKLKGMQVNKAEESIKQDSEQPNQIAPLEPTVVPRARQSDTKARRISVAVTTEEYAPAPAPEPVVVKPKVEGRKRTNTITGFLKIGTGKKEPEPEPAKDEQPRVSNESIDSHASTIVGADQKPRSLRFTFASNTTSSKNPDEIVQEVLTSSTKCGYKHRLISRYLVECTAPPPNNLPGAEPVKIEVEVCKLPRLKNLHGLRFKRVGGASADYKTVCEQLLAGIHL